MGKLLPLILGLVGLGAGVGAGVMLKPQELPAEVASTDSGAEAGGHDAAAAADDHAAAPEGEEPFAYLALDNQFIVPLVREAKVRALVVLSLSLEVEPGHSEEIYSREPKLQDAFLTVLFDHANAGGFDGAFTASGKMDVLRGGLREAARKTVGTVVNDVLITGIVRQEV